MGTWGFGILQDDAARDVYDDYFRQFNAGETHSKILRELRGEFADALDDPDDAILFWLAVARAQWECGALQPVVKKRVEQIVRRGDDLARWKGSGVKSVERRRKALEQFLAQLSRRNPKPRKPKKGVIRKPIFSTGDCLAIRLRNGKFAAAIVTRTPEEVPQLGEDTYGVNVIAVLRYEGR